MSPAKVLKVLIMTVVIMGISFVFIEIMNVESTSARFRNTCVTALNMSCNYFGQETYKRSDFGTVDVEDIKGNTGEVAVSGRFYNGSNADTVYNDLYGSSYEFKSWASRFRSYYSNIAMLSWGLNRTEINSDIVGRVGIDVDTAKSNGEHYVDAKMTPLNLGVPYLDKNSIEKIFKWQLVKILSNGKEENVVLDDGRYVKYNGFNVYFDTIAVRDITYNVYDIKDTAQRREFEKLTSIDATKLGIGDNDERRYITIASLSYSVDVTYTGVTPLREYMKFIWDTPNSTDVENMGESQTMTGGGLTGDNSLPTLGNVLYYIVR